MSRLFYDVAMTPSVTTEAAEKASPANAYLEKVAKLVPSEIVAAYIAILGLVPSIGNVALRPIVAWGTFGVCLLLTPIYLNFQAVPNAPKRMHLLLSSIAFVCWAYAVSGQMLPPALYDPAIGSIELILFSLVSGVIPLKV